MVLRRTDRQALLHHPPFLARLAKGDHLAQLQNYSGKALTYEEWQKAGWVTGDTGSGGAIASVPKPKAEKVKGPVDYVGVTAGVEQEITGSFTVQTVARGRLGKLVARDGGATLVEFETDIKVLNSTDLFTLEFKTMPCALDDRKALLLRREAQKLFVAKVREAGTGTGKLANAESESVLLPVDRSNFSIVRPTASKMRFANQITMGVKTTDLLAAASDRSGFGPELTSLRVMARAKVRARKAHAGKKTAGEDPTAEELGQTVINEDGFPIVDTSLPIYKNAFGTLPKTSPMQWLAAVPTPWRGELRSQIGSPPKTFAGPANVYQSIWKFIQQGNALAGHPIPIFTIGGEGAVGFEFRSMPSYDPALAELKHTD